MNSTYTTYSSLYENIQHMPALWFWIFIIAFGLVAISFFRFTFKQLKNSRLIKDTPQSKIRSAAQGFVEIIGTITPLSPNHLIAPLTGKACCFFKYKIEYERRSKDKVEWVTVDEGRSNDFFLVKDETGECVINPLYAEIYADKKTVWVGNELPEQYLNHPTITKIQNKNHFFNKPKFRFTELYLNYGDKLFAFGFFQTISDTEKNIFVYEKLPREIQPFFKTPDLMNALPGYALPCSNTYPTMEKLNQQWEMVCVRDNNQNPQNINLMSFLNLDKRPFILSNISQKTKLIQRTYKEVALNLFLFFGFSILVIIGLVMRLT